MIDERDVLVWVGGSALRRFGAPTRKTAPINRGGESLVEQFTRAAPDAIGTARSGKLISATTNVPRLYWVDLDGDGLRETPCIRLEGTRTNLVLRSEDFSAAWAAINTPVLSGTDTSSGISLGGVDDNDGAAAEGYSQTITFTGNATKTIAVEFKKDTSISSVIRLRDTTAGADRLLAVITWSGTTPVITMTTGTNFLGSGAEQTYPGIWRAYFTTTSVTAANTNSLQVYPATDSALAGAASGKLYLGGVQAENATFPSTYIKTLAGTVIRAADQFKVTSVFQPMAASYYVRFIELGSVGTVNTKVFYLGNDAGTGARIYIESSGTFYRAIYTDGTTTKTATLAVAPTYGQVVELLLTITSAGVITLEQSIAVATSTSAADTALALPSAWSGSSLWLNSLSTSNVGFMALESFLKTRSVYPMADFRTLIA